MSTTFSGDEPLPASPYAGSSQVVERALDVLLFFLETEGDLGVSEIARRLGMDKAGVHRFLTAFRHKGLVAANPRTRRYSLGFRALEMGFALSRQFDVAGQVQPFLRELRDATGETSGLAVLVGDHRIHLAQVESEQEIRQTYPLGKPLPMYAGAAAKVLLAFLPPREVDRLLSMPMERLAEGTTTDPARLRRELLQVRSQGYATSEGERMAGSRSIAAPVWSWRGDAMAVNVSGPAFRFTAGQATGASVLLRDVAARLTRHLGGEPFAASLKNTERS